jgi:hypothetical protein
MAIALTEKAVVGRRILFTRYSDLGKPDAAKPGIITELIPTQGASLKIRLDGQRYTLNVPVFQCESEDIVILTGDQHQADAALGAFCKDMLIDREFLPAMQARWAVFEWEPEDSEYPWTVSWDASEGDDQAIRIHYLPA